jgi:hypothetical protein
MTHLVTAYGIAPARQANARRRDFGTGVALIGYGSLLGYRSVHER